MIGDEARQVARDEVFRHAQKTRKEIIMPFAEATPGETLITPTDHILIMIDHQSQMAFATKSIDATLLRNNVALVANAAREFGVSTIVTTVAEKTFSGPVFNEIKSAFPDIDAIDRTTMNTWEDARITAQVNRRHCHGNRVWRSRGGRARLAA